MNDDDIEQDDIIKENNLTENTLLNKYSNNYKEMPFYLMTLEDNFGECKQIKIYQDSDPFELSYNFCKENNLDFESMKYIKKNIKEIIKRFSDNEKKESNFINSDSIYELVDEENFDGESDEIENDASVKERNITEKKASRSSNKLICSLMKRKIKFNHKINGVAPLQKKINEQIKKISHIKKNDFTNSQDIISNKNKKSNKLNEYNLIEIKNNNTMYSSTRANELSVKKNRLMKNEKNWNSDNKKTNTYIHPMDPSEYGVPELKNNENDLNMFKYVEKVLKKNDFNIDSNINQKYDSGTRKYEDEEDDLDNDEDDEKSIPKEKIKNIKIEIETTDNNKQKVKKNNSFHLNKMVNNINNNNYSYNYNYHINNNNNININNNNIFNNINALNYNNEQYPFNYIDSNQLMEHNITYKKISKEIKKDNQSKKNKKNIMNKEKVKDANDINDKKNLTYNTEKRRKIKEIKNNELNKECFDCGAGYPEYISINNGIFICKECLNIHNNFPKQISNTLKNNLSSLNSKELEFMYLGGNQKLLEFINYEYPQLQRYKISILYQTKAMQYYRNNLHYLVYGGIKPIKPNEKINAYELININEG